MITTKQKWLLGGLLAMSAGVWTPQILGGGGGGDSSAQVALDGPTEAEMLEMEAEMGSWDNGGASATGGAVGAGASGGTTSSDRQPGEVDGPDEIVGSILGALGTSEVFSGEARHKTLQEIADEWARESGDVVEVQRSPLAQFLEDNPFNGTMTGETDRIAMVGAYMVREGDTLPGTAAVVREVTRNSLTLATDAEEVRIDLPPLRASLRYARERESERRRTAPENDETMAPTEGAEQ
ncbi:MAG: hypothetical protein AAF957_12405 [Planctomycetota bacterium]